MRVCLKLSYRSSIKSKDFGKIYWFPVHERVSQCSICSICIFFTKNCPNCFDDIYLPLETNGVYRRSLY